MVELKNFVLAGGFFLGLMLLMIGTAKINDPGSVIDFPVINSCQTVP